MSAIANVDLVVPDLQALGSCLRDRRLESGVTQRELGERIGVAQPAIARIEAGRRVPTIATLQRMATALGCDLIVRIGGERVG